MSNYKHISVLPDEVLKWLDPKSGQNFIDCTLGRGGHTMDILKNVGPDGKVLSIDLDSEAIEKVKGEREKVKGLNGNLILVQDNFRNLKKIYEEYLAGLPIHGILLDLGVSSPQLDNQERGFSFKGSSALNMNFDKDAKFKAETILNKWSEKDLIRIFREYGEEKFANQITKNIILERQSVEIKTTDQLVSIIKNSIPYKVQRTSKIHPATKIFQALRIAVNDELGALQEVLPQALELLEVGGRIVVISFHSLEDRIVKQFFVKEAVGCVCPPDFPICQCNKKSRLKILTKKPVEATEEEVKNNPRSRSAKMRVAEKIN